MYETLLPCLERADPVGELDERLREIAGRLIELSRHLHDQRDFVSEWTVQSIAWELALLSKSERLRNLAKNPE